MKNILGKADTLLSSKEENIKKEFENTESSFSFFTSSINKVNDAIIAMACDHKKKFLMILTKSRSGVFAKFDGKIIDGEDNFAKKCPLNATNAAALRELFPWSAPTSLRKCRTTIGCGDRLGLASAGYIGAIREFRASPVLAQQSIQELKLTGRTYQDVVDDATFITYQCGYTDGYGADGDHLKTLKDIDMALKAGMPTITLELSDVICSDAENWTQDKIDHAFANLEVEVQQHISATYFNREFDLCGDIIAFDEATAKRCAVMYLEAMDFAKIAHDHIKKERGDDFDLGISFDETSSPTPPEHHFFIAKELIAREVCFTSLAPHFVGDFQVAIDYIGDLDEFERQFKLHALIAQVNGDYKISITCGSDKFKIFPIIGKYTNLRFHLKTGGTSWLEALRTISHYSPELYRVIYKQALDQFNSVAPHCNISADLSKIPPIDELYDEDLPKLLDQPDARQLLHISYGSILGNPQIRGLFFAEMYKYRHEYVEMLHTLFERYLEALGIPRRT